MRNKEIQRESEGGGGGGGEITRLKISLENNS